MTELKMGMEVQTRDGRPAKIIYERESSYEYPLIVVYDDSRRVDLIEVFTRDGKKFKGDADPFIIPKPQTRTVWLVTRLGGGSVMFMTLSRRRRRSPGAGTIKATKAYP